MSARIERLIGLATLQGPAVTGYRRFGVPPGGAFDQESYRLGCALAGCEPGSLAIELSNAAIEIDLDVATGVAVVGAEVEIEALGPAGTEPPSDADGRRRMLPNVSFDVLPGQTLKIAAPRFGLRVYLCVAGGWVPDGVDSLLARAGRRLAAGDVLGCAESLPTGTVQRLADPPTSLDRSPFGVLPVQDSKLQIPNSKLVVSHSSDRTGIRLDGLDPVVFEERPSEPTCLGAIQLTPSGQLIVIGPDGPTIGGYPKIGAICSADLGRLAHLRPGQEVELTEIDLEEARRLAEEGAAKLRRRIGQLAIARA